MMYKVRVGSGAAMHWVEVDAANAEEAKQLATKSGGKAYSAEPIAFSPDVAITKHGGIADTSGINWSYAKFPSQRQMALFIVDCNNNGYRTRNDRQEAGYWFVQYHHIED